MEYDSNRRERQNNYQRSGGYGRQHSSNSHQQGRPQSRQPLVVKVIEAEQLPEDYVETAEEVMRKVLSHSPAITTSKLRNLLSLVTDVFNVEQLRTEPELLPESVSKLQLMRIRVLYEAGREQNNKEFRDFMETSKLLEYLKGIGTSRKALIQFAHYMEALVAYHRYLGGKER